jgi:hypothetical protein
LLFADHFIRPVGSSRRSRESSTCCIARGRGADSFLVQFGRISLPTARKVL